MKCWGDAMITSEISNDKLTYNHDHTHDATCMCVCVVAGGKYQAMQREMLRA